MAPIVHVPRKPSLAGPRRGGPHQGSKTDAAAMPPPPDPNPAILGPEVAALSETLKTAVVKSAEVLNFCVDAKRLGIHRYMPYPPRSLTAGLGREIEKYDQMCDAIESQLLRALSILTRDLEREKSRLQEEYLAAHSPSKLAIHSPSQIDVPMTESSPQSSAGILPPTDTDVKPQISVPGLQSGFQPRRPSSISISSLNRSPFPLKLDLSAVRPPLSSPVTLAPKTGRPKTAMEEHGFLPDLLSAMASQQQQQEQQQQQQQQPQPQQPQEALQQQPQDIQQPQLIADNEVVDLTIDTNEAGATAEKPIELDLFSPVAETSTHPQPQPQDVDSLFTPGSDALFTPVVAAPALPITEEGAGDVFAALTATAPEPTTQAPDPASILASLVPSTTSTVPAMGLTLDLPTNDLLDLTSSEPVQTSNPLLSNSDPLGSLDLSSLSSLDLSSMFAGDPNDASDPDTMALMNELLGIGPSTAGPSADNDLTSSEVTGGP